jgi:tetratricopeptide (TPR) repeat protein
MGTAFRFGAEFFYDFGDPLRAAELFSRFTDPASLARQADALWIADHREAAATIRTLLVSPDEAGDPPPHDIRVRSLYNVAANAPAQEEELRRLERLLIEDPDHVYGIIRYTRLMDTPRAIAILEGTGKLDREALLDLELLKRRGETWPPDRLIPETWMLLGRHSEDAPVYQWGAWYFDWQKQYEETALLLRTAGYNHIGGPWTAPHESLALIREGQLEQARALLEACLPVSKAGDQAWQIHANLGRIFEAERSPARALEQYEAAAALAANNAGIAAVQLRIARVLRSLGRNSESRQALEYGREKDPENIHIRLELGRLD